MNDLKCKNLSMTFTNPQTGAAVEALKDINFTLKKGELLSVLGPSGCGKTTLLNMIAGFINPTAGEIFLGGKNIDGPGVERGMVFQQGALFEWLTVSENVSYGLRMKKTEKKESQRLVEKWLDIVGLNGFDNTPIYQLSGGMQQRVALARCLVNDPDVILMDEPLGALDALTREKMQSLILELWKETGKTIMINHPFSGRGNFAGRTSVRNGPPPGQDSEGIQLALFATRFARIVARNQAGFGVFQGSGRSPDNDLGYGRGDHGSCLICFQITALQSQHS